MLSLTLKELERDGLVNRTYHPTISPKVECNLTDMGVSFREPVNALGNWALDNLAKIDGAREAYDEKRANNYPVQYKSGRRTKAALCI